VVEHLDVTSALTPHRPATVAAIGELVRQAAASSQSIYPAGGQTQWDLGPPPSRRGFLVDIRQLDQVVDYPARDMTITVQAGMTVARLQEILAGEKQRLPIDVPRAERATLGGILATNVSGPRRYGHGTMRDYVIGISAVNDRGEEVKAGGRVVKNVAGYDFCKLHIGALGTLCILTQVTFKLKPLAAEQALFAFPCPAAELENTLAQLHTTRTRPMCIELLSPEAAAALGRRLNEQWPSVWSIVLAFEDNADGLKWQVMQIIQELGGRFSVSGTLGDCCDPLWRELIEFAANDSGSLTFKAGLPASAVAPFCVESARVLEPVHLQAHAGNGIVVGHCLGDDVIARLTSVRERAIALGGHLIVTRCPVACRNHGFVWGPPRGDWDLMRAIKQKLDPGRLFNPGRFVVG